jgi:outer membrane lipoprotein-sorting protein
VSLGRRQIAGRQAEGIQFTLAATLDDGQRDDTDHIIWRDAASGRLLQVEIKHLQTQQVIQTNPDGTTRTFTFEQSPAVYNDFTFDTPLDDSLFTTNVPPGYQLKQDKPVHRNAANRPATAPTR